MAGTATSKKVTVKQHRFVDYRRCMQFCLQNGARMVHRGTAPAVVGISSSKSVGSSPRGSGRVSGCGTAPTSTGGWGAGWSWGGSGQQQQQDKRDEEIDISPSRSPHAFNDFV